MNQTKVESFQIKMDSIKFFYRSSKSSWKYHKKLRYLTEYQTLTQMYRLTLKFMLYGP